MLTTRTLADCREVLASFEGVHGRWHALMLKAVDARDIPALREMFDEAPETVTEHERFMDLWKIVAQAEHEVDTTAVIAPPVREA